MPDEATQKLYETREKRIRDAVALKTPDRVPVVPNGPAWPARALGVPMTEIANIPEKSYKHIIEAYTSLGDIDGIQAPAYDASTLPAMWLSRVKVPGRELPEDEIWQVDEMELMTLEDYEAIASDGFGPWLERYYAERLPGNQEQLARFLKTVPDALAFCREKGVVPFAPAVVTIPYEYFCGGRSMRVFLLDLYRHADKVEAAMEAALPVLIEQARGMIRAFGFISVWVGGWRSASEFVSPKLWDRFVFPYYQAMVDAVLEEGAIPLLHFDANWDRDIEKLRALPQGKCILSLDGKSDIFRAKRILEGHMCLMGDVPASLFSLGAVDEVRTYCKRLINEVGPGGFILSSGCDVPVDAKYENVKAFVESVA